MEALIKIEFNKQIKGKTFRLSIFQDDNPDNPREDDNLGKMVCWHKRYQLGDEQPKETSLEWMRWATESKEETSPVKLLDLLKKSHVVLPLYLLDHSGLVISTSAFSDHWDSGPVGLIYVSRKKALEDMLEKKWSKKAQIHTEKILKGEVKDYDDYLRGNIYGYVIESKQICSLGHEHWEHVDSCRGFHGNNWKENGLIDNLSSDMKVFDKELMKYVNRI